jgi:hypothetical protein
MSYYLAPSLRSEPNRLGFWRDHGSLYATGGLGATGRGEGLGASGTGSAGVELLRRGIVAEARVEQFRVPERLQYRTVRVGRLGQPAAMVAAGVTLGYRDARGSRAHEGVEVGFPFVAGRQREWLRFEAAYVVSHRQSSWNYRLQGERLIGRGPFFAGMNVELKAWEIRRHGELSHGTLALLFGTTYRGR